MPYKAKIKSILMQAGGQGDGIIAANGLQALIELNIPFLADDGICFTRSLVEPLVKAMLPGLNIRSIADAGHSPHPRYHLLSKISWTTVFRNYFSGDFYYDFAERRRLASFDYPPQGPGRRLQQYLTDMKLSSGTRVLRETPSYYALKMWAPVAAAWGVSETALLRGLYMSYRTVSQRLRQYADDPERHHAEVPVNKIAIFPGGGSFQFLPADFIRGILSELMPDGSGYTCYFAPGDPMLDDYVKAGLNSSVTNSVDDILQIVANADITVTADSFVSHLAQLISKEHVALMSHDLPQHTIHPAARSRVVFEPLDCCPCYYTNRRDEKLCPAGYECCAVFLSGSYREQALETIKKILTP
ncbi:MAG: hypothetical protein Q7U10_00275 [Thermodesulfovibrionia bacterium]|nr:hypothetical protein [Thermodesulfovibrionia bacterium]